MPLPVSSPASRASSALGTTPMPTTTRSAAYDEPFESVTARARPRWTLSPAISVTHASHTTATPRPACTRRQTLAVPRAIDRRDTIAREHVDPVIAEELRWAQLDLVHPLLVEDESFRERRPLVGEMRLVADERDRFLVAFGAQRRRGFEARLAGADDHAAVGHQR